MSYWKEDRQPTLEEAKERLAYLEREIAAYPCWGAALTAMDEEARGLRRYIAAREDKP